MALFRKTAALVVASIVTMSAHADDDLWFGVRAGTLGLGLEATWRAVPFLDFRAGLNGFSFDQDGSEAGVDYDGDIDLQSFYLTGNLRVPLSPFRFTAGVFRNGNEINLVSRDSSTFQIGGSTFTGAQVGTLRADADFDTIAPYAGVGADFRVFDTFGLNVDLGVLMQGSPALTVTADGLLADDPTFQSELEVERMELQEEIDDFDLYPVLSLGFSWNF
ncbi:MAG: hypothetical protein AB8G17_03695 [Gammaproteobacteria bacterium]